jgi:GNAT superfamily N-acetyltransferase
MDTLVKMAVEFEVRALVNDELAAVTDALPDRADAPVSKHALRLFLQEEGRARYLIAWRGDEPVGHVLVYLRPNSEQGSRVRCAELEDLFVREDARGHGAGTALLAAAEAEAGEAGAERTGLAVTVSNPHNDAARHLYERCGYRDSGLGDFITGYDYWDKSGQPHRDEEPHRYLYKQLG